MQTFYFTVTDKSGKRQTVAVQAPNREMARAQVWTQFSPFENTIENSSQPQSMDTVRNLPPVTTGSAVGSTLNQRFGTGQFSPGSSPTGQALADSGLGTSGEVSSGSTAATNAGGGLNTLLERELADPSAAFRAFLEQQGAPTRGFTGGALQSAGRFIDPVITLSEAAGLNAPGAGLGERLPGIFAQGGITRGLGNLARQSLQSLGGATSPNASQQAFITPESFGSDEGIAVRQALQQALTGRNPFLGSRFGSQIDQELGRRVSDAAFAGNDPLANNFIRFALSQVPV